MASTRLWLLLISVPVFAFAVSAYKVLFIPVPAGSHIVLLSTVAEAWVKAGHEAHVVKPRSVPIPSQFQNSGIHYVNHGEEGELHISVTTNFTKTVGSMSQMSILEAINTLTGFIRMLCQDLLTDEEFFKGLEKNKYDFVLVDEFARSNCLYAIAHRLNVPYGSLAVMPPLDMLGTTLQVPYLSARSIPMFYSREPSFLKRFSQFLAVNAMKVGFAFQEDQDLIRNFIKDRPVDDLYPLRVRSKIWIIDQEPLINEPKHASPNMIHVGGISAAPAKPLPTDLQKFADSAKEGLVVVSFGGSLTAEFPEEMLKSLLIGFSMIKNKVIIRLKTKPIFEIGKNILVTSWLPQNDLLGHKNTVLFITHCGVSSINEAVYHGIPMLGFPNQFEQRANAIRFTDKNYGFHMDRNNFTSEELKNNVEKILTDKTWKNAIQKSSDIIKGRRFTAQQEAVYWMEHVIKYGGDHLVPYSNQLSWYQIMMNDIMAAILAVVFIVVFLLIKCCRCCKRVCCGKRKEKQS